MRAHPASEIPPEDPRAVEREALDPDDYRGGYAVWSGTSFSAPLLAARIARQLLEDAAADPALALDQLGPAAATNRTVAALREMHWPG